MALIFAVAYFCAIAALLLILVFRKVGKNNEQKKDGPVGQSSLEN